MNNNYSVIKQLAKLHAKFGLYDKRRLCTRSDDNIIYFLRKLKFTNYITSFYNEYVTHYNKALQKNKQNVVSNYYTDVSRTIDLPFIGSNVIKKGKADYFFVFEGSLSRSDKLSIVVLALLWLKDNPNDFINVFDQFWPNGLANYKYIIKCLGITPSITKKSYVTDAVRIPNRNQKSDNVKNRIILMKEILLLDPKLIIIIGYKAKDVLGSQMTQILGDKCFFVPFPLKRKSKDAKAEDRKIYCKLRNKIRNITTYST